jgi:hypothetical protein
MKPIPPPDSPSARIYESECSKTNRLLFFAVLLLALLAVGGTQLAYYLLP